MKKTTILIFLVVSVFAISLSYWYFSRPNFEVEKIRISITDQDFEKLRNFKDEALEAGVLKRSKDDYVNCTVVNSADSIQGEMRLKGDWVDHLKDEKWSFRVKLKNPLSNGIKTFSLQSPKSRDFLNGYVFHRLLRYHDILSNEMTFVELMINNESWGIYNFEEHLSERMIASQGRPEGVILNFEDDIFFDAILKEEQLIGLITKAKIKVRGSEYLKKSNKVKTDKAKSIIENYQFQRDSLYQYFDADAMAKYYAICDVARAYHAMGWINIRFYYNFKTELMEPIGYDGYPEMDWGLPYLGHQAIKAVDTKQKYDQVKVVYSALYHDTIRKYYEIYLIQLIDEEHLDQFLKSEMTKIQFFEKEIQKEFRNYKYNRSFLIKNAKAINAALVQDGLLY